MPEIIKNKYIGFTTAFLLAALLFATGSVEAQSAGRLERRAEASFKNHDYYTAAKLYAAILYDSPLVARAPSLVYPFKPVSSTHTRRIKESRRSQAQYQLAESYRLYYHYKDALPQYELYIQSRDTRFPLSGLWYGMSLLATDQPEKAISSFNTFLQKYRTTDSFAQKARLGIADANFRISSRSIRPEATIAKMTALSSEDGSNFGMQKMNDGSYWFTSSRHEIDKKKEKIYPVRLYSTNAGAVQKITDVGGDDMNTGAASLSADGLTLYFTGWKEDKKSLPVYYRIYSSTRSSTDAKWSKPVALSSSVNVPGFNAKQPFITTDNRYLFFVSDRPGGYGKYDIWMVNMDNGNPTGAAINPGSAINTDGEEASPFYDSDSTGLYYSSNGKIGMGGMDIYKINGKPISNEWALTAINLGSPVNSVKDDVYYVKEKNSDIAYVSSDRASNCCLEIFKAVQIHYKDSTAIVKKEEPVKKMPVPVVPEEKNNKEVMDSINLVTVERMHVNYNFASAKIRKADRPQLDHIVSLLKRDPTLHILIASFTDCIGSRDANIRLSRKRSESVKQYLVVNGIDTGRINIDFFGKKHLIVACKEDRSYNKENQLANRRSDLIVTHDPDPKWQPTGEELDIKEAVPGRSNNPYPSSNPSAVRNLAGIERKDVQPVDKPGIDKPDITKTSKESGIVRSAETGTGTNKNAAENTQQKNTTASTVTGRAERAIDDKEGKRPVPAETNTAANKNAKDDTQNKNAAVSKINDAAERTTDDKGGKEKSGYAAMRKKPSMDKRVVDSASKNSRNRNIAKTPVTKIVKPAQEIAIKPVMRKKVDSLHTVMKIAELLDFTPRLKNADVINEMTSRTPRKSFEVFTTSDSVKIELYDNGVFDNDSVSVIYNKKLTVYKQMLLTNKPIRFYVKLDPDQAKNEMIFFAENLGITPPNSALMIITDGDNKRTEVNVTSDLHNNAVIYFIKVKK
jgi:outer membrane protein OmpA-like peptidoglycan-associated protein